MKPTLIIETAQKFFEILIELGNHEIIPTKGMQGVHGLILVYYLDYSVFQIQKMFAPDMFGSVHLTLRFETADYTFIYKSHVCVSHLDDLENGWTMADFSEDKLDVKEQNVKRNPMTPREWLIARNEHLFRLLADIEYIEKALAELREMPLKLVVVRPKAINT